MQIEVASQRILLLKDLLSAKQASEIAWQKKLGAFDALSKVTSFLSKPKDEDFSLTYSEHRYEPFWHVVSRARYEYTRTTNYQIASTGAEVKTVTIHDTKYDVLNGHFMFRSSSTVFRRSETRRYSTASPARTRPS